MPVTTTDESTSPSDRSAAFAYAPLERGPTLSERVADQLQELILSGHIAPGERLPSERELAERFGVSRTVIREAVRRLTGTGLVAGRAGSGVVVREVASNVVRDSMNRFLRSRAFLNPDGLAEALAMLHEVRTMLEVQVAGVAARARSAEDVVRMRETADAMAAEDDLAARAAADVAFHREIALATHNELYVVLLDSIEDPLLDIRLATLQLGDRLPDAVTGHGRILAAVEAGDVDGARAAMTAHLKESEQALIRLTPQHLARSAVLVGGSPQVTDPASGRRDGAA
jgi:GntR family transcriptional repressor for pyruvate dehydrogenase complex